MKNVWFYTTNRVIRAGILLKSLFYCILSGSQSSIALVGRHYFYIQNTPTMMA